MVKCPNCGHDEPLSATSCAICSTPLPRPAVATAVLTPVPVPPIDGDATIASELPNPYATTGSGTTSLVPGQTFGNRYQIISLLGVGGMGAVYHVWDSELALSLALKVIKPEIDPHSAQELERRFKRELVLARQVTHTNVIRIHDLGEINGIKYITMPFVHGTDLARLLASEGKLPVPRVLTLARQIVSGLRAAHEVGVVHRDLKPANILIDEQDKAIITDFGIARSTDPGTFATAAGAIMGTLAYMAPEQATGRPVDQRADIYALGLILYEMLVGKRSSTGGDTALALLIERSRSAPPRLRTLDASIPEALDLVVARCLEPDPVARYQDTRELEAALDRLDVNGHERLPAAQTPPPVPGPPPAKRFPLVAGVAVVVALAGGAIWMLTRPEGNAPVSTSAPSAVQAPRSVLIADFDNQANDPVFTGSLEQALNIAIEGASFITTFSRTTAQGIVSQLTPGATLDESAARLVAEREGINVVITGSIALRDKGYVLAVKAINDPASGGVLTTAERVVSNKSDVLTAVTEVASDLRRALGDATPRAAAETVTTKSLEALQNYTKAQDLSNSGKQDESIAYYKAAINFDPDFGRAYAGWATALFNTRRNAEAAELWKKAMQGMDRMTERERYRTLGGYFLGPGGSYEQAIQNYEKLVAAYPADRAGRANLALAYFHVLDFPKAMEHGLKAVELYPKNARTRQNYALYAMYAGDMKTAEAEARKVLDQSRGQYKAYLPLAAVAFAASDMERMRQAYEGMRGTGPTGASLAMHGLADLAMYEGRWADAEKLLEEGIAADADASVRVARAAKYTTLAELHLAQNRAADAVRAVQSALALTREDDSIVTTAALVFLRAGRRADAQSIARGLAEKLQPRSRAYAAILEGELARTSGRFAEAYDAFGRAQKLADLWLGRSLLGVAYVERNQFPEAQAELGIAEKRRGEAAAIFLDDVPTFRYLAPLPYWFGRTQEGMKSTSAAADSYRKFLTLRAGDSRDPLAADARKRLQALSPGTAAAPTR